MTTADNKGFGEQHIWARKDLGNTRPGQQGILTTTEPGNMDLVKQKTWTTANLSKAYFQNKPSEQP